MRRARLISGAILLIFCQVAASQRNPLDELISDPAVHGAWLGVLVQTTDNPPKTLYALNGDKRFMPASNTKLFTTALALEKLGPDFTFITPLLTDGQIDGERLNGNIYIKGSGDPSLTRNRLRELAKALSSKGVKFVKGNIVVDVSAFSDNRWGTGWSWDYLHYGYAAEVWAIALDRNSVTVQIAPSPTEGQPAQISVTPSTDWLIIDNRIRTVKTGQSQWSAWRDSWERVVRFEGQVPLSAVPETIRISVPSIPHYVGETFRKMLQEEGIVVFGDVKAGLTPPGATEIAETKSPPLKELVWWLNKVSDNLYAEMLLRAVALKEKGQGSVSEGLRLLEQQLQDWGIDVSDVRLVDGSGLSRLNMVTPRAIVKLLQVAKTKPWFEEFKDSLPVAGKDGTLRTRFLGTSAEGCVFAKTGYIGGVVALSGYIQRRDGTELVFSVLVNHYNALTRQVQLVVDRFVASLVEGASEPLSNSLTSSASSN
ncbi:MAG: D-alanyl-D-alanine carboxypeptidase/D-alanyl-D-alanine-endopeptidase [Armatimonadota bacterium]|nr:D-alanyl-D-alanine carboxypeptidase/D-alanyl-D-alanine-endopeptidase [Armatimonadota bacterium]MDW8143317.1 D-alanyl-D-alanine carboxypeptidase/D-alanyl-D-alanine-endopeptidase [Armatimonadota bacterium]